jgi:UDP-N-acetylmuramoyl-tripeptide--D-alanyl-D-alanine ligase
MSLLTAAQILEASLHGSDHEFTSVSTDTRSLQTGALFVALQGPNFDGHGFVGAAQQQGAVGCLVSESPAVRMPSIQVKDTRVALGQLAAGWRQRKPVPLVAVTGSNGKTTVKEMIAAILSQRASVLATQGNLNNDIGMPLTLLRLQDEAFAVIEMGANHPGEIAYLTHIARPNVAVITNAGAAHLEGFGDLDGVARAKGEILSGLAEGGTAVLNMDDLRYPLWRELAGNRRIITFGFNPSADVSADLAAVETVWTESGFYTQFSVTRPSGQFLVSLRLAGRHNLLNALAAIAACQALAISVAEIQQGLSNLQSVAGRLQTRISNTGLRVIDDSYNANPDSMLAAIDVLKTAPGRRWLVMGDLAELGEIEVTLHARVGEQAKAAGIDFLWSLGEKSCAASERFGSGGRHFADRAALVSALTHTLVAGDSVLVKGSRSAAMEQVVADLLQVEDR